MFFFKLVPFWDYVWISEGPFIYIYCWGKKKRIYAKIPLRTLLKVSKICALPQNISQMKNKTVLLNELIFIIRATLVITSRSSSQNILKLRKLRLLFLDLNLPLIKALLGCVSYHFMQISKRPIVDIYAYFSILFIFASYSFSYLCAQSDRYYLGVSLASCWMFSQESISVNQLIEIFHEICTMFISTLLMKGTMFSKVDDVQIEILSDQCKLQKYITEQIIALDVLAKRNYNCGGIFDGKLAHLGSTCGIWWNDEDRNISNLFLCKVPSGFILNNTALIYSRRTLAIFNAYFLCKTNRNVVKKKWWKISSAKNNSKVD